MKKYIVLLLAMILMSVLCVTSVSALPNNIEVYTYVGEGKYIHEVVALSFENRKSPEVLIYGERYEYYIEDNTATSDETTPDEVTSRLCSCGDNRMQRSTNGLYEVLW